MTLKRILLVTSGALLALALIAILATHLFRHEIYHMGIDSQAESLGLQSKTLEAGGFTWSYFENDLLGQKPSLVMVHGFGASKETWLAMSQYLANDFHLVLLDLPGHGDSTFDPSQNYNLQSLTHYFNQFAEAKGLTGFHMIGNSLGGGVTGLFAGTHPSKLASAIMLAPAGIVDHRSDFQQRLDQGENPLLIETVEDLEFLFEYAVAEKISIPWPFNQVSVEKSIAKRPILDKVFADLTADPTYHIKAEVADISAPTLVIWGEQDRLIAPQNAELYKQANPAIQVKLLDQVGHIPMVEIPQVTAEMVVSFIGGIGS